MQSMVLPAIICSDRGQIASDVWRDVEEFHANLVFSEPDTSAPGHLAAQSQSAVGVPQLYAQDSVPSPVTEESQAAT